MSIQRTFGRTKVLLPVIHVMSEEQALRNARYAVDAGADGVFLINHDICYQELLVVYRHVQEIYPDLWIGLNLLDVSASFAAQAIQDTGAQGLWTDETISREKYLATWDGIYFGGVAFKYQPEVADVALAAQQAVSLMDVITTSGTGTGSSPDMEKIRLMREAIGSHPLAIASGITLENIHNYLPYTDCFLVATGISVSHTELDPVKVTLLAQAIHGET